MQKLSLNGKWEFSQVGTAEWLPANVPGSVYTDLLALNRIPDPFIADNELSARWIAEVDWEYRKSFYLDKNFLAEEKIFLHCAGLDTLAEIKLNGQFVGFANNMFRNWQFKVKSNLKVGPNELTISFSSPLRYIKSRQKELLLQDAGASIKGAGHLRKSPYQFGWDWGPTLPDIGIWKNIQLIAYSHPIFEDVNIKSELINDKGIVNINIKLEQSRTCDLEVDISLFSPAGEKINQKVNCQTGSVFYQLIIENPLIWWTNGLSFKPEEEKSNLYNLKMFLKDKGEMLDCWEGRIGFRKLELQRKPDQWGESFQFVLNEKPIFCRGANWIPADSFPARIRQENISKLLKSAKQAGMNMLRIWGGGYYPDESFFDLCDELGILVWQDFMFACSQYPGDEEFIQNVKAEIRQQVKRLRHHACLALWCGNNEIEQGWAEWGWDKIKTLPNEALKQSYQRLFYQIIPEILKAEDPGRPYWPSSASSDDNLTQPNSQSKGDCHYWDVWHGKKPFTSYRLQFPRFMSEFGFQSLPALKTIEFFTPKAEQNLSSYIMDFHQRSWTGNSNLLAQMADYFRMPKDFASLVYLSQILQAEGIRYGIEHWRRNRKRVGGTLYWQLNDCWPGASWSSLDYFGRWKALHYAAKRFYAPVLLSLKDEGQKIEIHLTNDLLSLFKGKVSYYLESCSGEKGSKEEIDVFVPPLTDLIIAEIDFSLRLKPKDDFNWVLICELKQEEKRLGQIFHPFVPNKHLNLEDPGLSLKTEQIDNKLLITISSQRLARFIELSCQQYNLIFSDNYFDLNCGGSLKLTAEMPEIEKSCPPVLQIKSLYDSYN